MRKTKQSKNENVIRSDELDEPFVDVLKDKTIIIYPNPTKGRLRVEISRLDDNSSVEAIVYSLSGSKILHHKELSVDFDLNLTSQNAGVYVLKLKIDKDTYTWKIIKE